VTSGACVRVCRGEVNVDIFAADEIASGVSSPSTEMLASPSHTMSMSDFKADVGSFFLLLHAVNFRHETST